MTQAGHGRTSCRVNRLNCPAKCVRKRIFEQREDGASDRLCPRDVLEQLQQQSKPLGGRQVPELVPMKRLDGCVEAVHGGTTLDGQTGQQDSAVLFTANSDSTGSDQAQLTTLLALTCQNPSNLD